jgi:hypothetical protein
MKKHPVPDNDKLRNLALGKLPPEEASELLKQIESDRELAGRFEVILKLMNVTDEEWAKIEAGRKR